MRYVVTSNKSVDQAVATPDHEALVVGDPARSMRQWRDEFQESLAALDRALSLRPFGERDPTRAAAGRLRDSCDAIAQRPAGMSAAGLIGVFDSGVGGLSVWREIVRLMPGEDTIYLADQAHVPYGTQSLGTVRYLSEGTGMDRVATIGLDKVRRRGGCGR